MRWEVLPVSCFRRNPSFSVKAKDTALIKVKTGAKSILKISLTNSLKCWKLVEGPLTSLGSLGGITWCSHISLFYWEEWVLSFLFPLVVEEGASSGAEMGFWALLRQSPALQSSHQWTAESSLRIVCLDYRVSAQTWGRKGQGIGEAKCLNFNLAQILCHSIFLVNTFFLVASSICKSWISFSGINASGSYWCKGFRRGMCSSIH